MGDRLEISLDDGSKMAMTVRENSALLDDPKSGTFVLTLDEDASLFPDSITFALKTATRPALRRLMRLHLLFLPQMAKRHLLS